MNTQQTLIAPAELVMIIGQKMVDTLNLPLTKPLKNYFKFSLLTFKGSDEENAEQEQRLVWVLGKDNNFIQWVPYTVFFDSIYNLLLGGTETQALEIAENTVQVTAEQCDAEWSNWLASVPSLAHPHHNNTSLSYNHQFFLDTGHDQVELFVRKHVNQNINLIEFNQLVDDVFNLIGSTY